MSESKTVDPRILALEQIDLNQWVRFGEGTGGEGYFHVTDEDLMLKLYNGEVSYEELESEYKIGFLADSLKLPVPACYKMVACGDRLGIVFQRLREKVSIARAIGQNPDCMEEYIQRLVDIMHQIHATQANVDAMVPAIDKYSKAVEAAHFLNDSQQKYLHDFIDGIACPTTCIHGDFHMGNVVVAQGKTYAIDLSTLSYGNPLFDEASMCNICFIMPGIFPQRSKRHFHIDDETLEKVWRVFCRLHAGAVTPSQREEYEHMLLPYVTLDVFRKAYSLDFNENQMRAVTALLSEIGR